MRSVTEELGPILPRIKFQSCAAKRNRVHRTTHETATKKNFTGFHVSCVSSFTNEVKCDVRRD